MRAKAFMTPGVIKCVRAKVSDRSALMIVGETVLSLGHNPDEVSSSRFFFSFFYHSYSPFTRKRIVSLCFGRYVRTRLGVAIPKCLAHLSST